MKIINSEVGIFSDPHYGIHRNGETWHKIALKHAKWTAEQFRLRGIKDIIIDGDVFHDRTDIAVNTLHVVTDIFNEFVDFNVIILVGNHDAFYRDKSDINSVSILKGWTNITVIDKLTVYDYKDNIKIAFCPWGQDINKIPNCDIIFGHFAIKSFKMNSLKVCTDGINSLDLLSKARLIVSGHFHHKEERKYNEGTILYVGCPYQQDWGDYGTTKGLYILDLETQKYEFIKNDVTPQYHKIKYSELASGKYTVETLKQTIQDNIIRFYIDKQIQPIEVDTILRKLVSIKPTELTLEYDYTELTKYDEEMVNAKDFNIGIENSIAEFIDTMDIKNKDTVKTYVTDLYHKVQAV